MTRPVQTRGYMVQMKIGNESMQHVDESTHSVFLGLSRPVARPVQARKLRSKSLSRPVTRPIQTRELRSES